MTIELPLLSCDFDRVREAIAKFLSDEHDVQLNSIKIHSEISRPYSTVSFLCVTTNHGSRRFVFKRMKNSPLNAGIIDASEQAVVEYAILSKLFPKFSTVSGCSVPRPIAVFPADNAYIMVHVEGHVLDQEMRFVHYFASLANFRKLRNRMYLCGKWLRHFQEFTGQRPADASAIDNVVQRYQDRMRMIEEAGDRRIPKDFRSRAMGFLEKHIAKLTNTEILVTGRHGDFGPWNTLAGPEGVTVLDFFGFQEDPLPVDILGIIVFLDSSGYGIANSASRIRTLQEEFLEGYGPVPKLPVSLVLLCEAQQRIQQIAASIIASDNGIFSQWERSRSLRANIEWFLTDRDESSLWPVEK